MSFVLAKVFRSPNDGHDAAPEAECVVEKAVLLRLGQHHVMEGRSGAQALVREWLCLGLEDECFVWDGAAWWSWFPYRLMYGVCYSFRVGYFVLVACRCLDLGSDSVGYG